MQVLARQLAAAACDSAALPAVGAGGTVRNWLGRLWRAGNRDDAAATAASDALAHRLDAEVRRATDELIALYGLSGHATAEVLRRLESQVAVDKAADPGATSVVTAAVSGALGGLAADLAAGGLTFGAGALLGGILGAAGGRGLASAYNLVRGTGTTTVRWSGEFLTGRVTAAVLRYLAVAHFGRGRGDFVTGEYPAHWSPLAAAIVASRQAPLANIWGTASQGDTPVTIEARLRPMLEATASDVLERLYPAAVQGAGSSPSQRT
jgi:hypothetical protein